MNGRTEFSAAIAALVNALFGILAALGFSWVTPELVSAVNGIVTPIILMFLGARITRVEDKADTAAVKASVAADKAAVTSAAVARVENKVSS